MEKFSKPISLNLRDSKSNSWHSLSVEVPFIAPVIAT